MPLMVPTEQSVELQPLRLPGAPQLSDRGAGTIAAGAGVAADEYRAQQIIEQRKRNATRVFEAESALADREREMRTAAQQKRGSSAYGVRDMASSWWEAEPAKIEAELENETQRELFRQSVARRREVSLNGLGDYETRETTTAAIAATDARATNAVDMAAANYNNQEAIDLARQEIRDAIGVKAAFTGMAPDAIEAARVEALTKLHQQVIENLIDDDPEAAREYFTANRGEIAGTAWDGLDTKLKASADVRVAQRAADDIWARGLSRTDALAAARAELEGPPREQALALLRQQYQEREQAIDDYKKGQVEAARSAFANGGIRALTPNMVATLERVAPAELRAMRDTRPQDQIPTNWDVYDGMLKLAREDRALFADSDLQMMRADLNTRELAVLEKLQADIRADRISPTATLTQVLAEVPWDTDQREERGLFDRRVREDVAREQFAVSRELTTEEVRRIVDRNLMEVKIPRRFWYDRSTQVFALTPEDREALYVELEAIPQSDRAEIEAALTEQGIPVTPDSIVGLFRDVNGL